MDILGHAMTSDVKYPEMRSEVVEAVRALSDPEYQRSQWGRYEDGVEYYDDLTLNIHVLYDDCMVLPDPHVAVPDVLRESEVQVFAALERALGPMIEDLGNQADAVYIADPRWHAVVEAAARVLLVMRHSDVGTSM